MEQIDNLDQCYTEINKVNREIKFSTEKEKKTITRSYLTTEIKGKKLDYNIYRKSNIYRVNNTQKFTPPAINIKWLNFKIIAIN